MPSFYQEDLAYVHDVGYSELAKNAALFLLEQLKHQNINAVILIGEVVNYLFDNRNNINSLQNLFTKIYASLTNNGLLIFDIIEPGIIEGNSMQKRIIEEDEWTMFLNYVENREKSTLQRDIILFRKLGSLYRKSQETHVLNLYRRMDLKKILEEIGFQVSLIDNYNGLKFRKNHVGFIATKKGTGNRE